MKKNLLFCWFQRTPGKAEQCVLELSFSSSLKSGRSGDETEIFQGHEMKVRIFPDWNIRDSDPAGPVVAGKQLLPACYCYTGYKRYTLCKYKRLSFPP